MKRALVVFMLVVAMLFASPAAQAGWLCDYRISCGEVTVDRYSTYAVLTTADWDDKSPRHYVYPGQRDSYRDTDGFYVPRNTVVKSYKHGYLNHIYYGPGWYKLRDFDHAILRRVRG